MLAFDLPDYSKSSMAQNEKLAQERQRERNRDGRRGFCRGPISMPSPWLSRILPPSPRASRRFGVAVMSKSEETQSGQLLMWKLRGKKEGRQKWRKVRKKEEEEIPIITDVSIHPLSFRSIKQ